MLLLQLGAQITYITYNSSKQEQGKRTDKTSTVGLLYPTRLVPAERLDKVTGLVEVGGDALADSEALYDPDWN